MLSVHSSEEARCLTPVAATFQVKKKLRDFYYQPGVSCSFDNQSFTMKYICVERKNKYKAKRNKIALK